MTGASINIRIQSDVPDLYKNKVIAVGKAILSSEMKKEQRLGVEVKVRDSLKNQPEGYMNMMRGGNRQMRRMMDKMGLDMEEIPNVQEVIIKTDKKEIIIPKPSVTEMKSKENSIFQVIAESFEEKELEVPIFSEDDIMLVCQQANCDEEKAKDALAETKGDIAQAILRLTSG